ncbi:MAG: hypothetical protein L6R48_03615 [Planctomycetes bacterium]|nr:hypothetical protein [Planctomycetota bacterium]
MTVIPASLALALACIAGLAGAEAPHFVEDDCRPADLAALLDRWEPSSAAFAPAASGIAFVPMSGGLRPRGLAAGRQMRVEILVQVEDGAPRRWASAGVRIQADPDNYWQLALAQAPSTAAGEPGRRFLDLGQRRDSVWHAEERAPACRIERSGEAAWLPGRPYRLRLELDGTGVRGVLSDPGGAELAGIRCTLPEGPAVRHGQPLVQVSGCAGTVLGFRAEVGGALPPAPAATTAAYDLPANAPGILADATGFFRIERLDGAWWVVDPLGRGLYLTGMNLPTGYRQGWPTQRGARPLRFPYEENTRTLYPTVADWERAQVARLRAWGFNFSALPGLIRTGWVGAEIDHFTNYAALIDDKPNWCGVPDVFDPLWPRHCDLVARRLTAAHRGDPWLLGWYLGNELPWGTAAAMAAKTWARPPGHAGRRVLAALAVERAGSVVAFNRDWGTSIGGFGELDAATGRLWPATPAAQAVADAFFAQALERYFAELVGAFRRHDPQHLILGERFVGIPAPAVLAACGRHSDIVSINDYPRSAVDPERGVDPAHLRRLEQASAVAGRPLLISEWSFPALDAGLPSQHGAGMRVLTQRQRADCYRHYAELAASAPFIVGHQWFCLLDEPAEGISDGYPEDSNYGFLDVQDRPYPLLAATATAVNTAAGALHRTGVARGLAPPQPTAWAAEPPAATATGAAPDRSGAWAVAWDPARGWGLSAGGVELGGLGVMIKQVDGRPAWLRAGAGRIAGAWADDRFQVTEVEWTLGEARAIGVHGQGEAPAALPFALRVRYWFPLTGEAGWCAVQPVALANHAQRAWTIDGVYTLLDPRLGGDPAGDRRSVGSPCMGFEAWEDPVAGRAFGAWLPAGGTTMLWREQDGTPHSDICQPFGAVLAPGQEAAISGHLAIVAAFPIGDLEAMGRRLSTVRAEAARWLRFPSP